MPTSVMVDCPGHLRSREPTNELSAVGNSSFFVINDCPERMRRAGHRPGGGEGYPESWERACSTCSNEAEVTQQQADEVKEQFKLAFLDHRVYDRIHPKNPNDRPEWLKRHKQRKARSL